MDQGHMWCEGPPFGAKSTSCQTAIEGMHQIRQWPRLLRDATPEDPCPRKAAEAVQIQSEGNSPDPAGRLLRADASFRVQVTEKDQREVEVLRMRLTALVVRHFLLDTRQQSLLPFAGPQRKEQTLSHRPRAAPADAPRPGARTGGAPPRGCPRTAPAGSAGSGPRVPKRSRRFPRVCPQCRRQARRCQ